MNFTDLPVQVQQEVLSTVHAHPEYLKLAGRWRDLLSRRLYVKAAAVKKQMDNLESLSIDRLMKREEMKLVQEQVQARELLGPLTPEELETWNVNVNAAVLLCDMIEVLMSDCNQILRKYHPDCRFQMYDTLVQLGKEASAQVSRMNGVTTLAFQTKFGDAADDMRELVMNKARAFVRRMNKN